MWDRIKQIRKNFPICNRRMRKLWILMGLVLFCGTGMRARAEENSFVINANKMPSDGETYNIQISIENQGADWEGTVRLTADEDYRTPTAYDTAISLPQGSTKQFVVKIPVKSIEDTDGTIKVTLWDKKSEKTAAKEFRRFLMEDAGALSMGILSDDYSTLTYLDMGGEELYFYGSDYPLKLVELNQGNIVDSLDNLEFLVIDTYNTEVLTDEELQAIELWNYDGGVLLVGTGSYAEDTLKGLGDSYLDIKYVKVHEPGELSQAYYSDYVDFSQLHMAELRDVKSQYNEQYLCKAFAGSTGDGAVGILPYALTELAKVEDSFYQSTEQENFVMNILDEVSSHSNLRYNNSSNYYNNNTHSLSRMLRIMGNVNNPLQFGVLNFIVILYVIFVGPILYIILRLVKKRELYWVTVPVTALVGIVLIFFAGRGFEVVNAKVYSVTAENLSGAGGSRTYLYCYNAGHKEWNLKLAKDYDYIGALYNDNYNYNEDEDAYYHHIQREGDTLSFGIKPTSNFEDSYFYAGKGRTTNEAAGAIVSKGIMSDWAGVIGTITNETNRDFGYYAVVVNDTLHVYENLAAGETCNLAEEVPVFSSSQGYDMWGDYVYGFLMDIYDEEAEKADIVSALGVGLCAAYPQNDADATVVIGVVEDWNKTVDDNCSEISYGCLYTIQ